MDALRRIASYYRLQFTVLRSWRPSGRSAVRRIIVMLLVSTVSLIATSAILPGISISRPGVAIAAAVALAAFMLLIRPVALGLLAGISVIAVLVATLVLQGLAFLFVAWLVPGFEVSGFITGFIGAIVYSAFTLILTSVLGVDQDESYWAVLVQQLVTTGQDVIKSDKPGIVIIQIDGLAHPILNHQIRAGQVPFITKWVRTGQMTLDRWEALLPSQTSASQAGILHGNNSFIPAFRWWEKDRGVLMVSNHPEDAAEIVRRASDGEGLLSNNGASVGNLVSGDAARAYITMATIKDGEKGVDKSRAYYTFFLAPDSYLRTIVLSIGEIVKEYVQAARQSRLDVVPRMHRGMPYPIARAATNVILRSLGTALVMEEMYRGTPAIYIDYTDYDEIAHHSGPERSETLDALDGVDRTIRSLVKASRMAPRPYRFVLLSDHGQSLGQTFLQRYGVTLESVVASLMGGPQAIEAATGRVEEWGQVNAFLSESRRGSGMTGSIVRRAFKNRTGDGAVDVTPVEQSATMTIGADATGAVTTAGKATEAAETVTVPELVVCASGNLGLVYFPRVPGRLTFEDIEARWPGLVDALSTHPGIGFVMVRTADRGSIAVGEHGIHYLRDDSVKGDDPVAPYGGHSSDGLRRVDGMEHCPDILVISMLDPSTDEVAAFEELIGSHGGLGGPQTKPFILHPSDWTVDQPIVGAEAVYDQIRTWMASIDLMTPPRVREPAIARTAAAGAVGSPGVGRSASTQAPVLSAAGVVADIAGNGARA